MSANSIFNLSNLRFKNFLEKNIILYSRVSTPKQKPDLIPQENFLRLSSSINPSKQIYKISEIISGWKKYPRKKSFIDMLSDKLENLERANMLPNEINIYTTTPERLTRNIGSYNRLKKYVSKIPNANIKSILGKTIIDFFSKDFKRIVLEGENASNTLSIKKLSYGLCRNMASVIL